MLGSGRRRQLQEPQSKSLTSPGPGRRGSLDEEDADPTRRAFEARLEAGDKRGTRTRWSRCYVAPGVPSGGRAGALLRAGGACRPSAHADGSPGAHPARRPVNHALRGRRRAREQSDARASPANDQRCACATFESVAPVLTRALTPRCGASAQRPARPPATLCSLPPSKWLPEADGRANPLCSRAGTVWYRSGREQVFSVRSRWGNGGRAGLERFLPGGSGRDTPGKRVPSAPGPRAVITS